MKNNKGVTLIVLVITIIVLLVLAGVAIASLTGNNSILEKAQEGKTKSSESSENEVTTMGEYKNLIQNGIKEEKVNISDNVWKTTYGLTTGDLTFDYDYVGTYITMAYLSNGSVYGSGGSMSASDIRADLAKPDGNLKIYSDYMTLKVSEDTTIKYVISGNTIEIYMNDSETPYDILTLTNNPRTSL